MGTRLKYEDNQVVHSKLYKVWGCMITRCNTRDYYAGRGIKVCEEWKTSFETFRKWAEESGYAEGLQIDRINNAGNYEPTNCRWVTSKENCLNRDTTRNFNGKSSEDIAKELGLTRQAINFRIRVMGMTKEEAMTTPKQFGGQCKHFKRKI